MKTKTAILYETGKPLVIEELEIPELKRGQSLVKILCSGLCRSQINEIYAIKGEDRYLPHTMGHEASGIVEKVGADVSKVKEGDYVVVSWIKGSGLEVPSVYYSKGDKKINAGASATFSEYAIISENRLTKISSLIPPDIGALLGCAVPSGGGIVLNEIPDDKNKTLAIFGVGGIGACALLVAAKLRTFSKIIAVDVNHKKLEYAKELGATYTINPLEKNVVNSVFELNNGVGVDYAIECAGSKQAMEFAFDVLKEGKEGRNGGLAIIAGNISKDQKIEIQPYELIKGKNIIGSWGGKTNTDIDIPFYARVYIDGRLPLKKLITNKYSFEDINVALEDLKNGRVLRAIIEVNKVY